MVRALLLAAIVAVLPSPASGQTPSVLRIKVFLVDAENKATPVPRHALLISDNPATAPPRRVVTGLDGTAEVRLRPGNYTVESDQPVAFDGKAYTWVTTVDIASGRDAVLDLTIDKAQVEPLDAAAGAAPLAASPSPALATWQDSVVALWTPTNHASGFVVGANGLVATSQRVIGAAPSVEVQLTPTLKVAATVLAANRVRDVAVLRIDPAVASSLKPVPLACAPAEKPAVAPGQEIFTIGVPLRQPKTMVSGTVRRVEPHAIDSDLRPGKGSAGGPVFSAAGALIGTTSIADEDDERNTTGFRVVPLDDMCEVVAAAQQKIASGEAPKGTPLPIEPSKPFPVEALRDAAQKRAGSVSPYQMSSSDFDIAFMTPVQIYAAQYQAEQASRRERGSKQIDAPFIRPLMDFANWSDYMADIPPVLLIRLTPKLVENFWTKVARGAASTQGVSIPPIKRLSSGFLRMRAICGSAEVTPIHPFKLERRISDTEGIYEGLYVFDPTALPPTCGTVKLVLYSEKEPDKAETKVVDQQILEQIWQDFAPYRAVK